MSITASWANMQNENNRNALHLNPTRQSKGEASAEWHRTVPKESPKALTEGFRIPVPCDKLVQFIVNLGGQEVHVWCPPPATESWWLRKCTCQITTTGCAQWSEKEHGNSAQAWFRNTSLNCVTSGAPLMVNVSHEPGLWCCPSKSWLGDLAAQMSSNGEPI